MILEISNNLIPIYAIAALIFFLPPTKSNSRIGHNVSYTVNEDYYHPIYKYIRKHNPNIPTSEAVSIAKHVIHYSKLHDMDPKLIIALMRKESTFNRLAVSSSSAKGLGQIKDFNKPSLGMKDSFSIQENSRSTVLYLKRMIDIYKGKSNNIQLGLASYFKGRGTVANHGIDDEARGYVSTILKFYDEIN